MCEKEFHDIIDLLSCCLFCECNDLGAINLKQVHTLINLLIKSNIILEIKATCQYKRVISDTTQMPGAQFY